MSTDDCLSCSDCKLEFIEKRWTELLLNWLNKCVHPKAHKSELNPWSMVKVLKKYRQDILFNPDDIDGVILCSDIEAFIRNKYPLLRLRYYEFKEEQKMYVMTSLLLFHCCVNSITGTVDGDICACLSKNDQKMILKFCEKLMDMEVTCNNIELAVTEAFDSVKQHLRLYRKTDYNQKPSKIKSEPSQYCYSENEMDFSSFNSMVADPPPTEGMKQKSNALKFNPAESESFEPCSISDMPLSSFNSMATDAAQTEKNNATFQSLEVESFAQASLPKLTPLLAAGKSPTGSMKKKITNTFKSVEYESFVPCSPTDRPANISKDLCKSPTGSIKKKFNTTIKTVEYKSYTPCPAPDSFFYNSKALEKSPTGAKKQGLNAKSKAKEGSYESCSSIETASNNSKILDKSPTGSLEQRLRARSKAKAKFKSYESYSSRDRSPCNSEAGDKTPTESRKKKNPKTKKKNPKTKATKYRSQSGTRTVITPMISIITPGKSTPDQKFNSSNFKSSVTVLPSVVTTDASYSEVDYVVNYGSKSDTEERPSYMANSRAKLNVAHYIDKLPTVESERRCLSNCACSRCSPTGLCCADPGNSMYDCNADMGTAMESFSDAYYGGPEELKTKLKKKKKLLSIKIRCSKTCKLVTVVVVLSTIIGLLAFLLKPKSTSLDRLSADDKVERLSAIQEARIFQPNSYACKQGLCQKVYEPTSEYIYSSLSRCILLCMGPQLWPLPIGYTFYSKKVVVLATNRLEYKFQSVPSEAVHMYLAEAFKLFLGDLAKLERYTQDARRMNISRDSMIKKMYIQMDVETDPDPRIRLDTEESYTIKVETVTNQVVIKLLSASFCGIRHALETLSQLILLDQTTGNLITLSNIIIKDTPSYKYRGLMIDTGRNYIPVPDIMRTIDAMASVKLNTFHWRISDVTSFPLHLPAVPQLFEYGSYARDLVYTKDNVKAVVRRAGIRGIRVLLEVAAPGPVGRAWSWIPEATCPTKSKNLTCNNVLCLRLGIHETVFDILQIIYSEILEMTKVDDVFHLSDGIFSFVNCFNLLEEREGFLDKALERLKLANKGFLPKLPIIWYTTHLTKDLEARTWDRFGVQITELQPNPSDQFLSRFKAIHSSKWDLSCEVKKQRCNKYRTWQDIYSWKSWRNLEVFTVEGGEAILWTDLVDTGNLDYHLWPRAAAVAERLWSDIALNSTVNSHVYVRLDSQRFLNCIVGRSKENLFRWKFIDDSALECKCGAVPQTMRHLISCPACPVSCTLQELMDASDGAKQVAEFWAEYI